MRRITCLASLLMLFLFGCDGGDGNKSSSVNPSGNVTLESIEITPESPSLAPGTELHLVATGIYTDGSKTDISERSIWSSSSEQVAAVGNGPGECGLVRAGKEAGQTVITVTCDGVSEAIQITVKDASVVLQRLEIDPAELELAQGKSRQFTVQGFFSDNSYQELTQQVRWSSSEPSVASVEGGLVRGESPGNDPVVIEAALSGHTTAASVRVTDAVLSKLEIVDAPFALSVGGEVPLALEGTWSDGSSSDFPAADAEWSSDEHAVAQILSEGETVWLRAEGAGAAELRAEAQGIAASASVTVDDAAAAEPVALALSPEKETLVVGRTLQFKATAQFDDGTFQEITDLCTFASSDESVATVSNAIGQTGLAAAHLAGTATITVTGPRGLTADAVLTVHDDLTSFTIEPGEGRIPVEMQKKFCAVVTDAMGHKEDVCEEALWSSGAPEVVRSMGGGWFEGVGVGETTISASFQGREASAHVTVPDLQIADLRIEPHEIAVPLNQSYALKAYAVFDDGSREDVTKLAAWTSDDTEVATAKSGVISGKSVGMAFMTAQWQNVRDSAMVDVKPLDIDLYELSDSGAVPLSLPFSCEGTECHEHSNVEPAEDAAEVVHRRYQLVVNEGPVTIENVTAFDYNALIRPWLGGIEEGRTLQTGEKLEFTLESERAADKMSDLSWSFDLQGMGTQFQKRLHFP